MNNNQLAASNAVEIEKYNNENDQYSEFEEAVKKHFNSMINKEESLFTTDAEGLFEVYLDNLPQEARQHYNCKTCGQFITRYGNLVIISEEGKIKSTL